MGVEQLKELIRISEYPVEPVLNILLQDKTTKENIVLATNSYEHLGDRYKEDSHIEIDLFEKMSEMQLQPRVLKETADQADRTKKKAEVMI